MLFGQLQIAGWAYRKDEEADVVQGLVVDERVLDRRESQVGKGEEEEDESACADNACGVSNGLWQLRGTGGHDRPANGVLMRMAGLGVLPHSAVRLMGE